MDLDQIKEPLTQYLDHLPDSIKVNQVIIFGSYLEGTATQDSDLDILVISDDFQNLTQDQRFDLLHPARLWLDPDIDPWGFTPAELKAASSLTLLGHVRETGLRFVEPGVQRLEKGPDPGKINPRE